MTINVLDMGQGLLTIGGETSLKDWSSQVRECVAEPKWDEDDPIWVLSGESMAGETKETWVLTGSIVQDFGATDSIQEFCLAHAGESMPYTFQPSNKTAKKLTGVLVIRPLAIGGEAHTKPETDIEFTLLGRPTVA